MRHLVLVPFVVLTTLWAAAAYEGCSVKQPAKVLTLCELVGNWRDYHGKPIRVRAMLRVGPEQRWLYDPTCPKNQGSTSVELGKNTKGPVKKMFQLIGKEGRAQVVLEGVFYGPEPYGDRVDPKLPAPIRERLEKAPRSYGHMGFADYEIQVTRVVEVAKVASDVP